ncbi:MAG: glycosyltransferase [Nanoarchaeota archaeon]|nr:glycosyltransferase [Nanoarchaeota archaeon]
MLSIIIPVWNQLEITHECIQAVMESTEGYEIIVVDNGSDPPFKPPFSGFNEMQIIRNDSNKGFPVAVNQGIREAKGDVVVLLNNDVIVPPDWAEHLIDHLDTYAIIGAMTNYAAGLQRVITQTYNNIEMLNDVAEAIYGEHQGESENVNFIIGFVMMFKKSLYDELGPFDESLWPCSGEEIDFCFKTVEAGYKVGIAYDVYVHHEGSQTLNEMVTAGQVDYGKLCERNDKHLAEKWGADFWQNQLRYGKTAILGEDALRLNLGCGRYPMPGFVNIDQIESVKPDLIADATELPYLPDSVDEIYCGHILEHLSWNEGQGALKHWLDILKPGGEIRIVVPNFDVLAAIYFQTPTPAEMKHLNDYFIYSYVQESPHRYFYSAGLLKEAMETAGFKRVERLPIDHPYYVENVDWQVGFSGKKA